MQAVFISPGDRIPHTPGSDVAAGGVVVQGVLVGVATQPIKANEAGSLNITGIHEFVKVNLSIAVGAMVYWDAAGDPVGGSAGSGALTTVPTSNPFVGVAIETKQTTDATVKVAMLPAKAIT